MRDDTAPMTGSLSQTRGRPALPLGTRVPPYGRIIAIHFTAGERYYSLRDAIGDFAILSEHTVLAALSPADDGGAR